MYIHIYKWQRRTRTLYYDKILIIYLTNMEYTLTTYKQNRGMIYETSDGHKYISSKRMVSYNYLRQARFACLRCAACGHFVSAESPCGRLELLNLNYFWNFFPLCIYCKQRSTNNFSYGSENMIFEIYTPKNPMSPVGS